jgi:hypothetical protein
VARDPGCLTSGGMDGSVDLLFRVRAGSCLSSPRESKKMKTDSAVDNSKQKQHLSPGTVISCREKMCAHTSLTVGFVIVALLQLSLKRRTRSRSRKRGAGREERGREVSLHRRGIKIHAEGEELTSKKFHEFYTKIARITFFASLSSNIFFRFEGRSSVSSCTR